MLSEKLVFETYLNIGTGKFFGETAISYSAACMMLSIHSLPVYRLIMFKFAKNLLRGSDAASSKPKEIRLDCDFFVLEGERWVSLSDAKCLISFEKSAKAGPSMKIHCDEESVSEAFALDSISNLTRFQDEEGIPCFQWIVKKGKAGDNMEEFGIRFESEGQADLFAAEITSRAQQTATVVSEFDKGLNLIEKVSEDTWQTLAEAVEVLISKGKKGDLFFTVQKGDNILFHAPLGNSLQLEFDHPVVAFLGLTPLHEDLRVLGIHCESEDTFSALQRATTAGVAAKKKNRAPVVESSSDVDMWEEPGEYVAAPVRTRRHRRHANSSDDDEDVVNRHLRTGRRVKTRAIVFSNRNSLAGYQVYDTAGSSTQGKLSSISSFNKIDLNPTSVMVHEADAKCLLLDPSLGLDKIFELDLERGKVVNEWTPGLGTSVNAILPVSSSSQAPGEKTFLGLNERAIFVIDPRVKTSDITGNRVKSFNYATNVKLNAAATDAQSHIVVTNKTGELRLFDGEANRDGDLKRAKTLLAGFGDAISHVELTADGEWILATCATYLVLVRTVSPEGVSGFSKSIGSTAEPITLALDYADIVKHKLGAIQFTSARFDEQRGLIVTSTGSLAVVWDFARIKKSGKVSYSLKPMKDFILDTSVAGQDVVAMYEHKLELARVRPT